MVRLTLAFGVLLCLLPSASANLSIRKEPAALRGNLLTRLERSTALAAPATANANQEEEFNITPKTEVFVNGQPCRYEEVPEGASILRMVVAPDRRTVLTIYFRTGSK